MAESGSGEQAQSRLSCIEEVTYLEELSFC